MSTRPIIGICAATDTASWGFWTQPAAIVGESYLDRVRDAGGLPLALVPTPLADGDAARLLTRIDGLLLIGGVDLEPAGYGEQPGDRLEATSPARDAFELALARAALRLDVPTLGVCRGLQIMNVATGGTLHQHLADAGFGEHRAAPGRLDAASFHPVELEPGSRAAQLAGTTRAQVASHHHQGVARLGTGAVVTGRAVPDGLPEALEWPRLRYALGVQWHPESAALDHRFDGLVAAAASRGGPR